MGLSEVESRGVSPWPPTRHTDTSSSTMLDTERKGNNDSKRKREREGEGMKKRGREHTALRTSHRQFFRLRVGLFFFLPFVLLTMGVASSPRLISYKHDDIAPRSREREERRIGELIDSSSCLILDRCTRESPISGTRPDLSLSLRVHLILNIIIFSERSG